MNIKGATSGLVRFLLTSPQIGGLEITDSAIRFFGIKKDGFTTASLRLPPGIIGSGKVKEGQKPNLVSALKNIHSQLSADSKKIINVVLTLSDSSIYIQSFGVSRVAEKNLAEAADLNLRMLSPMPIESSYFGWQKISESETGGGVIELLGAFVPASNIDDMVFALHDAGFGIAAVEFTSLSLVRQLKELKMIDRNLPYLVIHVTAEGLNFIVIRNGNLYFDYFYPWSLIQGDGRNISLHSFKEVVEAEVGKVFNFYLGHWGSQVKNALVVTPALHEEFKSVLDEKFPSLKTEVVNAKGITAVQGAALRGKLSRGEDFDISLSSETVAKIFEEKQVLYFISIWRNALFTVAGFILLVFALTDIYLGGSADKIAGNDDSMASREAELSELKRLEDKVGNFNRLVELVGSAKGLSRDISPFLIHLNNLAGQRVSFDRIYLQALDRPVTVSGAASSERAILEFKRQLEAQSQLADVNLSLSSIIMKPDGQLSFTATFLIKSLDFPVSTPAEEVQKQQEKKQDETDLGKELVNITEDLKSSKPAVTEPLIIFGKLKFKSVSDPATLDVSAIDEETANLFKSKLEESANFYNVQIISGFTKTGDGRVKFQIRFFVSL